MKKLLIICGIMGALIATVTATELIVSVNKICLNSRCIKSWDELLNPLKNEIENLKSNVQSLSIKVSTIRENLIKEIEGLKRKIENPVSSITFEWDKCYDGHFLRSVYCSGQPICTPYVLIDFGKPIRVRSLWLRIATGVDCLSGYCDSGCYFYYGGGGCSTAKIQYSLDGTHWSNIPIYSIKGGIECNGQIKSEVCGEFSEIYIKTNIIARYIRIGRDAWGPARGDVLIDCVKVNV